MAEVDRRSGRLHNRRRRYETRVADARTTRDLLKAATDYFWGTFSGLSRDDAEGAANRLVEHTDNERRRLDGAQ